MILFCKIFQKSHFLYVAMYQMFRMLFSLNNDTLILFSQKNFYVQEINGEKMQKLSAIVTTISDKQYHND